MSRDYKNKRIVVYPSYIDSKRSRREGRKIPLKYAVPNPSIDEITQACKSLSLNPEIEQKKYPRNPDEKIRIVIDKKYSKIKTLIMISRKISETRRELGRSVI
ncbi:MAG: signal recognition particle subunit SRP19/SEC65 family protein [Desulfurococcaceae archaeon]